MKFLFYCTSSRQAVASQEVQKILPTRGTACIFNQLCSTVITVCFALKFFCTPNQSYTRLNHFYKEYVFRHNRRTGHKSVLLYLCPLIADMSSDVMLFSGQSSSDLSSNTRLGTCQETPLQFCLYAKVLIEGGRDKWKI